MSGKHGSKQKAGVQEQVVEGPHLHIQASSREGKLKVVLGFFFFVVFN